MQNPAPFCARRRARRLMNTRTPLWLPSCATGGATFSQSELNLNKSIVCGYWMMGCVMRLLIFGIALLFDARGVGSAHPCP